MERRGNRARRRYCTVLYLQYCAMLPLRPIYSTWYSGVPTGYLGPPFSLFMLTSPPNCDISCSRAAQHGEMLHNYNDDISCCVQVVAGNVDVNLTA